MARWSKVHRGKDTVEAFGTDLTQGNGNRSLDHNASRQASHVNKGDVQFKAPRPEIFFEPFFRACVREREGLFRYHKESFDLSDPILFR